MRKKRGKFSTVFLALMPGAGHMYMGFMKTGLSLMSAFLFLVFFSSWLSLGPLLFILPLIWFYSFFDCLNKRFVADEEFLLLEDNYLFSIDKLLKLDSEIFQKRKLFAGIILLLLGAYLVFDNIMQGISRYIPREVYLVVHNFMRLTPQIIVGVAIIVIGIKLIIGKRRERETND